MAVAQSEALRRFWSSLRADLARGWAFWRYSAFLRPLASRRAIRLHGLRSEGDGPSGDDDALQEWGGSSRYGVIVQGVFREGAKTGQRALQLHLVPDSECLRRKLTLPWADDRATTKTVHLQAPAWTPFSLDDTLLGWVDESPDPYEACARPRRTIEVVIASQSRLARLRDQRGRVAPATKAAPGGGEREVIEHDRLGAAYRASAQADADRPAESKSRWVARARHPARDGDRLVGLCPVAMSQDRKSCPELTPSFWSLGVWVLALWVGIMAAIVAPGIIEREAVREMEHALALVQSQARPVLDLRNEVDRQSAAIDEAATFHRAALPAVSLMEALSAQLPDSAWVELLETRSGAMTVNGWARNATDVQRAIEAVPFVAGVRPLGAFTRDASLGIDRFSFQVEVAR